MRYEFGEKTVSEYASGERAGQMRAFDLPDGAQIVQVRFGYRFVRRMDVDVKVAFITYVVPVP